MLIQLDEVQRLNIIRQICKDKVSTYNSLFMTWDDIKEIHNDGLITIGSHTVNHISLANSKKEKVLFELTMSKKIIESKLGCNIEHFAYPYGTWSDVTNRDIGLVKNAGYRTAVLTECFPAQRPDMYMLPRQAVCMRHTEAALSSKVFGFNNFLRSHF
jgi:peptidoglycan/xylan/chitin deacetylase (PgdA/CDA1 family)